MQSIACIPSGPPSFPRGFKGLIYTPWLICKVRSQKQVRKIFFLKKKDCPHSPATIDCKEK